MFIQAIYLYDDKLKIVFNYCGKNKHLTISFKEIDALGHDDVSDRGSFSVRTSPPKKNGHPIKGGRSF